nr:hypothetical protein [Tanacetum cinerariifolium]
ARPNDDTARPDVSTARQELSTAGPTTTPTTTTIFNDEEMTLADTLIKLKDDKAKDKGKGVLEEPESTKKMTKSDFYVGHVARDEEIARQLEVKLQANVERERQTEEQASMNYIAKDMNKKTKEESSDKGMDTIKKRKAGSRMKRMSKRQKTDVDFEEEEKLKTFLKIDPDEEGIIDYEVMGKRFPIINWDSKFYHYDRHGAEGIYYRIFKSDGSSRWIKTFSKMVTRRYPLTTRTLERMLSLRLITEFASDAAYDLLRFIQKQIDESRWNDKGEKDL